MPSYPTNTLPIGSYRIGTRSEHNRESILRTSCLEVPYRYGSESRKYIPDFIVRVDDGRGEDDLLNLIVEIKGYRREDAKEKKATMETYWVPGVNNLGTHGRWAFAEFTDVYEIESGFDQMVGVALGDKATPIPRTRV